MPLNLLKTDEGAAGLVRLQIATAGLEKGGLKAMVGLTWEGKYTAEGKRVAPVRLALPFQDVETVNESAQTRNLMLDLFARNQPGEWRNRLIWGDKKYVLPSLLPELAGKVKLIYIDPPFATGDDFSYQAQVPQDPDGEGGQSLNFVKQPSTVRHEWCRC